MEKIWGVGNLSVDMDFLWLQQGTKEALIWFYGKSMEYSTITMPYQFHRSGKAKLILHWYGKVKGTVFP